MKTIMDAVPAGVWIAHDLQCGLITGNRHGEALPGMTAGSNLRQRPGTAIGPLTWSG